MTPSTSVPLRTMHPLVTVTICDHYARNARAWTSGTDADAATALGVVFGARRLGSIDAVCALECARTTAGNEHTSSSTPISEVNAFDFELAKKRVGLYAQTRQELEVVGYYRASRSGAIAPDDDDALSDGFVKHGLASDPVVIVVRCGGKDEAVEATWYERVGASGGSRSGSFERRDYVVETFEAERIAVDEVAKIVPESRDSHSARFAATLESAASATSALRERLACALAYLNDVKRGEVPCDHAVLRQIAGAMKTLRASAREEFRENFTNEYEDTLAINYLATLTKTTAGLNEFIEKFQIVLSEQASSARFSHSRRSLG